MPTDQPQPGAAHHASTRDWPRYFDAVAGKPPRETLLDALGRFERLPARPVAIDLGCGDGRDTVDLLRRGWHVLAIDSSAEAFKRLFAREDLCCRDRLEIRQGEFHEVALPPALLVSASYALPFCLPSHFATVWSRIMASIEPGGRFTGQLFGDRHEWASLPDRSHQTRGEVESLLAPFEVEVLEEEERDGEDACGDAVHWHLFHIVARKPGVSVTKNEAGSDG